MATMLIHSENPNFSQIIRKNPATPLRAKALKRGTMFGYFHAEDPQAYCIAFIDGHDEVSFRQEQDSEFEYIDSTRYNSPLFAFNAVREYLGTALNQLDPLDVDGYKHEVTITSVDIKRTKLVQNIFSFFKAFDAHLVDGENGGSPSLLISTTSSLHVLFNAIYLISVLQTIFNKINLYVDEGLLGRTAKALNTTGAPYYVRYIIRRYMSEGNERFDTVRAEFEQVPGHVVKFCRSASTADARLAAVTHAVPTDINVLDVGCGEGAFLRMAKTIGTHEYHAVDRDPVCRDRIEHKLSYGELNNVVLHDSLSAFVQSYSGRPFVAMFNEVIEHNSPTAAEAMLRLIFSQPGFKGAFITTPNVTFNINYNLGDELRHDDHKFEPTRTELLDIVNAAAAKSGRTTSVKVTNVGDEVDGEAPTLMVVVTVND